VYSSRLGAIYNSQATNRSAAGGGGGSYKGSSLLSIGRLGVMSPSRTATYNYVHMYNNIIFITSFNDFHSNYCLEKVVLCRDIFAEKLLPWASHAQQRTGICQPGGLSPLRMRRLLILRKHLTLPSPSGLAHQMCPHNFKYYKMSLWN
jgi:hypothetical protein